MFSDLKQHHIGCLVTSIDDFKIENKNVWNEDKYSQVFIVSSQHVKVCFLQMSTDTRLELVEPGSENQPLTKLLNKGITYYHIGFISDSYEESVEMLLNSNCRQLSEFNSEAFNGKRCAFFYHPSIRLIELIED
jgi:methylmalonyl-CoA/ethylmalonyl-CoA epimerase